MKSFFFFFSVGLLLFSCNPDSQQLQELDKAIANRSFLDLVKLAQHSNSYISQQAYRALYNTPGQTDTLLQVVLKNPSKMGFFALKGAKLNDAHLQKLRTYYETASPDFQEYILEIFGLNFNLDTHRWLIKIWHSGVDEPLENSLALSLSRTSLQYGLPDSLHEKWIQRAFSDDEIRTRSYLYGAYRSQNPIIKQPHDLQLFEILKKNEPNLTPLQKQYIIQILSKISFYDLLAWVLEKPFSDLEPTVQIEFIRAFSRYLISPKHHDVAVHILKTNNELALQTFFESVSAAFPWKNEVRLALQQVQDRYTNPYHPIRLASQVFELKAFKQTRGWTHNDFRICLENHPYSINSALALSELSFTRQEFLQIIVTSWDSIPTAAKNAVTSAYINQLKYLSANEISQEISFLESLFSSKDRGILVNAASLLENTVLLKSISLDKMFTNLRELDPEADIEVFQAFIPRLMKLQDTRAKELIQDLGSIPYKPLAKALRQAGYTGGVVASPSILATPNRKRLSALGKAPSWKLKTSKGDIIIELDAVRNPTTVWLIDSLSNSGRFDSVAFHRVIGNFVMQGGDFERGDGYGGGETVIPTEASELDFDRGAVGMASAGTDTESAQFFIMHMWHPHLNGRYTRFGKVISGIEAVDQIIVGDILLKARVD